MYITSTGMVSPVGLNDESSCAAMRAGIASFVELPYVDNSGEPIIGSLVPRLDSDLKRSERIIKLLIAAIKDCLSTDIEISFETVPLLVGMAEEGRPGGVNLPIHLIIDEIQTELGIRFNPQLSQVISKGHISGFEALRLARELLLNDKVTACLVCGVDSYINARSLLWLDQHWRLKTNENSDGVVPGEAAGAAWIQPKQADNPKCHISVIGLGFGYEKANVLSDEPMEGLGLTEATQAALSEAGIQMNEIGFRASDVTGESYGFREQGLTEMKLMRVHRETHIPLWHSAEYIGDTGAAAGVCQLVAMFHAFNKGYAPGASALCSTSAVPGNRAVAVLKLDK